MLDADAGCWPRSQEVNCGSGLEGGFVERST
jgi:hypothetical protein